MGAHEFDQSLRVLFVKNLHQATVIFCTTTVYDVRGSTEKCQYGFDARFIASKSGCLNAVSWVRFIVEFPVLKAMPQKLKSAPCYCAWSILIKGSTPHVVPNVPLKVCALLVLRPVGQPSNGSI